MSCGCSHFHIIPSSPSSGKKKKRKRRQSRSGLSSCHLYVCVCVYIYYDYKLLIIQPTTILFREIVVFERLLHRVKHEEKIDVYDYGVILLEIIVGRQLKSRNEVGILKDRVRMVMLLYFCFEILSICFLSSFMVLIIRRYKV